MNNKVVGDIIKVVVMVTIGFLVMIKVESQYIKNREELRVTKTEIKEAWKTLDSLKEEQKIEP